MIVQATSLLPSPLPLDSMLQALLSLLALRLCIASCSCGVPLAMLTLSRACLAITYCLLLLRCPSGDACTLTGSPCDRVLPCALTEFPLWCLHSHKKQSVPLMAWATKHPVCCCWASILALSPWAASGCPSAPLMARATKHPVCLHWASIVALSSWAASKHPVCHCWASIVALSSWAAFRWAAIVAQFLVCSPIIPSRVLVVSCQTSA